MKVKYGFLYFTLERESKIREGKKRQYHEKRISVH